MSQPPIPGVPPSSPPPVYGGYGGDLQSYGHPAYGQPVAAPPQPWVTPTAAWSPELVGQAAWANPALPPQRPAVIGLAATLAITASLQWVCALSFCWLLATAGTQQLGTSGVDGGVYHILNRFNDRLLDGLAWPLYLFPAASFVLGFLLLARRSWARLTFTLVGAGALAWSAWWLRNDLVWWLAPAGYIAIAVLVLWSAPANRWYGWKPASAPARGGQPA